MGISIEVQDMFYKISLPFLIFRKSHIMCCLSSIHFEHIYVQFVSTHAWKILMAKLYRLCFRFALTNLLCYMGIHPQVGLATPYKLSSFLNLQQNRNMNSTLCSIKFKIFDKIDPHLLVALSIHWIQWCVMGIWWVNGTFCPKHTNGSYFNSI